MSTTTLNPAPGETSLATLLSTLKTRLHPETFVFLTLAKGEAPPASLFIQMLFREAEGLTVITTQESAEAHRLEYIFPSKMITLDIHSSLEAVGFMAAVSAKLTESGIGVNPVSGFFHDHCFVPLGKEQDALKALDTLARIRAVDDGMSSSWEGTVTRDCNTPPFDV
ncbi:ACT domain-containing protein [Leptodontidium sp. 2 PMI_412]|nr:ACT domain-containing protein [Leptodontidium sp. 2 PMI_412]